MANYNDKQPKFYKVNENIRIDNDFLDDKQNKHYIEQYEGQTILLVFWATWCSACEVEMPQLDNLQKDFRKLPFKIIALAQDYKGSEAIASYYKDHDLHNLEIFYDSNNRVFRELKITGLPTAYLINSEGVAKVIFKGDVKWYDNEIRKIILDEIGAHIAMPVNSFKHNTLTRTINKPA